MAVLISLLRAINVGGNNMIRMEALREIYGTLGLRDIQTYLQSGNVVFRAPGAGIAQLPRKIETAIEKVAGFRPAVIVRTPAELREVIAHNPFAARDDIHPKRLLVTFLASDPASDAREKLGAIPPAPEEFHLRGRELYIYFPDSMARPTLKLPLLDRAVGTPGTGRNWNTVTKLLEIAEKLEGAGSSRTVR
jgi:uncharacterized protein (DUF1697 family)